jgi:hypothetical protein
VQKGTPLVCNQEKFIAQILFKLASNEYGIIISLKNFSPPVVGGKPNDRVISRHLILFF